MNREHLVDDYLAAFPPDVRKRLRIFRQAIRTTEPKAEETFSYQMPGYSYAGYTYKGMFVWFGVQSHHIGLYLRPPTIALHRRDLKGFKTTKSAVHFPIDENPPVPLIRRLVRTSVREMKKRGRMSRVP